MKQVVLFLTILTLPASLFAQGPLSPTAAPAPTMKSLAQIETRTPITNLPYSVEAPGSYYVTTNLTGGLINGGITILTNNVTIDLGGFTLSGIGGNSSGIVGGPANVVIRNGTLVNWGADGVNASGTPDSRFENLQFYGNGNIGVEAG